MSLSRRSPQHLDRTSILHSLRKPTLGRVSWPGRSMGAKHRVFVFLFWPLVHVVLQERQSLPAEPNMRTAVGQSPEQGIPRGCQPDSARASV